MERKLQLEENNNFNGKTERTCTTGIKSSFILISLLDLAYEFCVLKFTKEVHRS